MTLCNLLLCFGQFLDKVLRLRGPLWPEEGGRKDDSQVLRIHQVGGLILSHSAHGGGGGGGGGGGDT